jgi:phosphotransacetylase
MQRIRGMQIANPEDTLSKPHYFAAMMVQYGQADALVAGNQLHPTAVYRPLLHMIKPLDGVPSPFGAALVLDDLAAQGERVLVFADCSMHVTPSTEQLAAIAVESGKLARHILGRPSKVAMLSHSTKGSAGSPSSRKVAAATALARERVAAQALEIEIEGEIQADVALVAAIAARKTETSVLRGEADVLVFPNLDAADISLRLLRHLAGFRTYGQLVLGLARPAAQVPRAASVEHIFGTTVAVAVEAIKYHQIYPQGDGGETDW